MVLALQHTDMTKSHIARFFGKKDHTTVIHAEKKIAGRLKSSKAFQLAFQDALGRLSVENLSETSDKSTSQSSRKKAD